MNFLTGITNLTNWMGNVIMPTLAALFFALGVLRFAHGQAHTYTPWAGFMCLMVSGILRGIETFATQAAWNNPDLVWITLRELTRISHRSVRQIARRGEFRGEILLCGGFFDAVEKGPLFGACIRDH